MAIDIFDLIRRQDDARKFVSEHTKKGFGGVGFCEPENDPLVVDTQEIIGKPRQVLVEGEVKNVSHKSRFIVLANGNTDVISGRIGASVSEVDARKIFSSSLKNRLTRSFKPRNSVK